jgi:hypothetical protein
MIGNALSAEPSGRTEGSPVFEDIDYLARIVGYCAFAYGVFRLAVMIGTDRATLKTARADRDHLNWLKQHNPSGYELEIWLRDNLRRRIAGQPTDPRYAEYVKTMMANVEAGYENIRQSHLAPSIGATIVTPPVVGAAGVLRGDQGEK